MTTFAQREATNFSRSAQIFKRENPEVWKNNKIRLYRWSENQCMKLKIKLKILNLLQVIISFTDLKNVTHASNETIVQRFNDRYPADHLSMRTFNNYINILSTQKLIKKYAQKKWNKPCATRVLAPKLVERSAQNLRTINCSLEQYNNAGKGKAFLAPLPSNKNTAANPLSGAAVQEIPPLDPSQVNKYSSAGSFANIKAQLELDRKQAKKDELERLMSKCRK